MSFIFAEEYLRRGQKQNQLIRAPWQQISTPNDVTFLFTKGGTDFYRIKKNVRIDFP